MNNKILTIIIVVVFFIATTWYVLTKNSLTPKESSQVGALVSQNESQAGATLRLVPSKGSIGVGESFFIDVDLTSKEKIAAVDVSILFDQSKLELIDVSPGSFFTNAQPFSKKIDQAKGEAFYAVGSLAPKGGTGTLARFEFTGRQPGDSVIVELDDRTVVSSTETEGSVSVVLPVKSSIQIVPVSQ